MNGAPLRVQKPLTLRLFKRVLLFSGVLILLLAGARAWWEYQATFNSVQEEFKVIESTKAQSVAASLWDFDREQLALHTEGIRHFQYISYAAVRDHSGVVVQSGERRSTGVLDQEFPLSVVYKGQRQDLGALEIQADLAALRRSALNTALRTLALNAALVLLVAGLVFWLTSSMISRHLAAIAAHLNAYSLGGDNKPLALDKRPAGDELDMLASALNTMQDGLSASYGQVLAAQAEVRSMARFYQEDPSPVLRVGSNGQLLMANPASADLLAHLGVQLGQQLPQDYSAIVSRSLLSGEVQQFEIGLVARAFAFVVRPLPTEGFANIYGLDISERKAAEIALRKSEAILQAAMDQSQAGIAIAEAPSGRLRYVNRAGLLIRGVDESLVGEGFDESLYMANWRSLDLDGRPLTMADTPLGRAAMCGETSSREFIIRVGADDDRIVWANAAPILDEHGQVSAAIVVFLDITQRKRAEEALKRQVLALTQPLENQAEIRFADLFNLEDIQRIQDTFAESMNVASIITTPDGTPLTSPSNFCRLCRDVIRKTEKGLANCCASDALLGRFNPDGPTIRPCLSGGLWDAGASITVGGQHIANWLIGQVRNEAQDETALLRYAEDIGADREAFLSALAEVPVMSRAQFERVAKALYLLSSEVSLRAYQNAQQARFIHERQKAEDEVRRNNARLQCLVRVLQHSSTAVGEFLDDTLSEALALTESRFGYLYHYDEERREFTLNSWSDGVMRECTVKGPVTVYALNQTGIWGEAVRQKRPIIVNDFQAANPLKRGYPEGHVELTNFMTVPVLQGGRIVAVAGVGNKDGGYTDADVVQLSLLMDACWQVVARLDAETSERRERLFADALLDSVPGLVYLYDDQGLLVRWNKSHEEVTGYTPEELSRMHLLDWYRDDPPTIERISKAIERVSRDGAGTEEALLQTKDGRRIPFYFSAVRLTIEGRSYFTGIGIDITERKQAEEEVRRSLHEKEILLKEIHHRVKNNLQIISSLLFLQAEYVIEPLDRAMFDESQKRISAMALVHEELYGSADLSSVCMGDYVPRLVDRVVASSDVPVGVELDVEDMRLPVTQSIPCGLILNEMVMNAVKHAFRTGDKGRLRVSLARSDGQVRLAVEDNGPGLPGDFDLENPATLGLTLITSLARQLAGSIAAQNAEGGARFTLLFPADERE